MQKDDDRFFLENTELEVVLPIGEWIPVIVSYIENENLWISFNDEVSIQIQDHSDEENVDVLNRLHLLTFKMLIFYLTGQIVPFCGQV